MSQPAALFLRLDQDIRGPFGPDLLAELARSGVITPSTEASASATGPWIPLQALGDYAGIFPPRPVARFRARLFEEVNRSSAPPVDLHALIAAANRPAPLQAGAEPPRPAGAAPPNELVQILRENARIQAGFEKPVDLTPPPNRRRFDYLILMIPGNGFFAAALVAGWGHPTVMVYALGGMVIFSVGVTWVMYGVMGRY